jgi:hypothetical protein
MFHCAAKEKKAKAGEEDEEALDPSQYFENRLHEIDQLSRAGKKMYPHKVRGKTEGARSRRPDKLLVSSV